MCNDNIPSAVAAFKKMGTDHGFAVDVSEDLSVFTDENLGKYDALVFASTNNEVFDTDAQKSGFHALYSIRRRVYGVHSAIGTERGWTWFKMMIGGTFSWHAKSSNFPFR